MRRTYFASGYEIRSVLRTCSTLITSSPEKAARTPEDKGTRRAGGTCVSRRMPEPNRTPTQGDRGRCPDKPVHGQGSLPASRLRRAEQGIDGIDSGAWIERVNFVANQLSNVQKLRGAADHRPLAAQRVAPFSPEELVTGAWNCWGQSQSPQKPRAPWLSLRQGRGSDPGGTPARRVMLNSEGGNSVWAGDRYPRKYSCLRERKYVSPLLAAKTAACADSTSTVPTPWRCWRVIRMR